MRRGRRVAALSATLGTVVAVAGLGFVLSRLLSEWDQTSATVKHASWGWAVTGVLLAFAGMSSLGLVWRSVLAALGAQTRRSDVFRWYQLGNLGKYLPGGVFQVLGRAELAVRGGVPRPIAYNSVALSMGTTYLAGALVSAALLPLAVLSHGSAGSAAWVLLVVPVGLVVLHPRVLGALLRATERAFGGSEEVVVPDARASLLLVVRHVPGWLVNGLACWFVTRAFTSEAPVAVVLFAGIASWVLGFLVVVVPSGLGVREAGMVAVLQTVVPAEVAAAVAIASRLAFVAGDAIGALLALALVRRGGRPSVS